MNRRRRMASAAVPSAPPPRSSNATSVVRPRLVEFCMPRPPLQNSDRLLRCASASGTAPSSRCQPGGPSATLSSVKWNVLLFAGKARNEAESSSAPAERGLASFRQRLIDAGHRRLDGNRQRDPQLAVWASGTAGSRPQSAGKSRPAEPRDSSGLCAACSSRPTAASIPIPHDGFADASDGPADDETSAGVRGVGQRLVPSRPYSAPTRRDLEDVKRLLNLTEARSGCGLASYGLAVPGGLSSPLRRRNRPPAAASAGAATARPATSTGGGPRNPMRCCVIAAHGKDFSKGIAPSPNPNGNASAQRKTTDGPVEGRTADAEGPGPRQAQHFTYRRNFDGYSSLESWQLPVPRGFQFAANIVPAADRFSPTRRKQQPV